MHNFVYLAQRRSQEFSCEPNYFGGVPPPPGCASGYRCWRVHPNQRALFTLQSLRSCVN